MTDHRHSDLLKKSDADAVALAEAVEERFLTVCRTYIRIWGSEIKMPVSLKQDLLRWRTMRLRHKKGDFRNSDSELASTKAVAQWTVDVNAGLRGQPVQTLQWKE